MSKYSNVEDDVLDQIFADIKDASQRLGWYKGLAKEYRKQLVNLKRKFKYHYERKYGKGTFSN
jgi:hypothetical protein